MKIIFLSLVELDIPSGPTVHTLNLIKGFNETDVKIKLLCPKPKKNFSNYSKAQYDFIAFFGYSTFRLFLFNILTIFKLFSNLLTFKPDIIYFRDRPDNLFVFFFSILFKIPVFIEMNGFNSNDFPKKGSKNNLYLYFRNKYFKLAKGIIFNCQQLCDKYSKQFNIPKNKSEIISMYVDCDIFKVLPKNESKKKLNIPENTFVIGYLGGFSPRHDIELLTKLIPFYKKANIQVKLLLVGDTIDEKRKENLKQKFSEDIRITGWVEHSQIVNYINAMDVGTAFVKESDGNNSESFLKIKEYLACGIPIVMNSINQTFLSDFPKNSSFVFNSLSSEELEAEKIWYKISSIDITNQEREDFAVFIKNNFALRNAALKTIDFFLK